MQHTLCEHQSDKASFPGFPTVQFLITCSMQKTISQKLDTGKAWERGYVTLKEILFTLFEQWASTMSHFAHKKNCY